MEIGVPDWLTTTVFGAISKTRVMRSSMFGGRDISGRSDPSHFQSPCVKSAKGSALVKALLCRQFLHSIQYIK